MHIFKTCFKQMYMRLVSRPFSVYNISIYSNSYYKYSSPRNAIKRLETYKASDKWYSRKNRMKEVEARNLGINYYSLLQSLI